MNLQEGGQNHVLFYTLETVTLFLCPAFCSFVKQRFAKYLLLSRMLLCGNSLNT